ncbi:DUF6168 family protein [uncultured Polaribacter sp.]|jgi:hypothetical protein|uniref:DUF6168 family protein n=1 Tax=uncultured Polaribacter sp. TaxID=174711 RepID=UPI00262B1C08|nr:DUF6168 family protein [uncultured Polaribacter sp.]
MIRSIIAYAAIFFCIFIISFSLHEYLLEERQIILPFSLKKVYLFHLGFSLIICTNFVAISRVEKIFDQLGYIYLGTILLKLIIFIATFYKSIITGETLPFITRISLLIPMIIFLFIEAIIVAKILKKNQ